MTTALSFIRRRVFQQSGFVAALICMCGMSAGAGAAGEASTTAAQSLVANESQIESITGLKGTRNEGEGVFKVSAPRTDVPVVIDGQPFPPFMGLTSWAAFKAGSKEAAMVMGDLVLFQDEVNPVMSALFDAGLDVTALHNHFFFDEPKVYFMHIAGEGDVEKLARGVRAALDMVKSVRAEKGAAPMRSFANAAELPTSSSITAPALDAILGTSAQTKDGMYKAVFGRTARMPCGCEVGKEMGVNTWLSVMGKDDNAIAAGDFVAFDGELQPVLRALRKADIQVVAIHNHMEGESPKAIFLHYWGRGPAAQLARGVRSALDAQKAASTLAAGSGAGGKTAADAEMSSPSAGQAPAAQGEQDMKPNLYPLEAITWKQGPPSLPPGAQIAVLEGDPAKEGPFVFRLKVPDGYRIPPHTHPKTERITVIAGTFNIGMGEKFDPQAMQSMPAGTYGYWPAGMKHFVSATGETILQFHGVGPWTINYVNPADDPRKQRR